MYLGAKDLKKDVGGEASVSGPAHVPDFHFFCQDTMEKKK